MAKKILFGLDALRTLHQGSEVLYKAVSATLGPRGHNAVLDRGFETVSVHDGVTVAREVELPGPENNGVKIIRQAANKQVEEVGDGTTVVTVLAHAILTQALEVVTGGTNAMSLRRSLEEASDVVVSELTKIAKPVTTLKEKIQVATISAEEDQLGQMIGETLDKVGTEGIVDVVESKGVDTYVEHQEGMQFEGGYITSYFVTNAERMEATIEDPYVIITDKNIPNIHELVPLLNKIGQVSRNVVIIAPDVTDSALASLIVTKQQGGANVLCAKAPHFGQNQKDFLEDIAILTNGTVISQDAGQKFDEVELDLLGRAQRVTATRDATLIVGGNGDTKTIVKRIEALRAQLERNEGSAFEQEKLRERIAKLAGGVAVIKVGGHTEAEMKERVERAKDAVAATQAAILEGIVPGGETAYLWVRRSIADKRELGYTILYKALKQPFYKLLENAGLEGARYDEKLTPGQGVDVTTAQVKDMVKAGIIDPVKVAKAAVRNAVSVAIQVMIAEVLISQEVEKKDA